MQTINITSRQNPLVKKWVELRKQKDADTFIVEGAHLVEMAAMNKSLIAYISVSDHSPYNDLVHYIIHPTVAEKLSELKTSPGIFGLCQKNSRGLDYTKPIVYLDDLRDPGNLGTIMRSSLAFGFDNVVSSPESVAFFNPKVLSGGQGAHFALNLEVLPFFALYNEVKARGYQIIVTTLDDAQTINAIPKSEKIVLVIGNEARGVDPSILKLADQRLRLKMSAKIESLNAGVAASIIMHHHFIIKA